MTLMGFEPAIPTSDQPQNHTLERSVTGIGSTNMTACRNYAVGMTRHDSTRRDPTQQSHAHRDFAKLGFQMSSFANRRIWFSLPVAFICVSTEPNQWIPRHYTHIYSGQGCKGI
jgi:hypothetical protein